MSYTVLDAIEFVLEEEGKPQDASQLSWLLSEVELARAGEEEVRAALERDIGQLDEESRFARTSEGRYALRRWTAGVWPFLGTPGRDG
ncbi:MAG: hypothetical protein ACYC6Y_09670 [Thermoguttaceae bacterium]